MAEEASKLRGLEARVAALETKFNFLLQFIRSSDSTNSKKAKPSTFLGRPGQSLRQFQPLPIPVPQLYTLLVKKKMITPVSQRTRIGPQPKDYNKQPRPVSTCEYHQEERSGIHTVENCLRVLRHQARATHCTKGTKRVDRSRHVPVSSRGSRPQPTRLRRVQEGSRQSDNKGIDKRREGRTARERDCMTIGQLRLSPYERTNFQARMERIKEDFEEFCEKKKEELGKLTPATPLEMSKPKPDPVVIQYATKEKVVLQTASVSTIQSSEKVPKRGKPKVEEEVVGNLTSGLGGITRSGRCYTPEELEKRRKEIGKTVEDPAKTKVAEDEATDFLRIIKSSEYSVVKQLSKMPSHISVLALLLASESHRKALLKVLNEAYVPEDITGPSFENMVTSILVTNQLTFSDDELPPEGRGHVKALYISVKTNDRIVSRVLIDNGSALNVCPLSTLEKLDIDPTRVRVTSMIVRAFDGTRREVLGEIDLPVEVGPQVYNINFQVLKIDSPYNLLLGRPWLHTAGAVPSSLHQKMKLIIGNQLVTILAEEPISIYNDGEIPYIDGCASEEASFHSFEFVTVIHRVAAVEPRLSKAGIMVAKEFVKAGFQPGQGLGYANQGRTAIVTLEGNKDRYGLGYTPTRKDRQMAYEARRQRAAAKLRGEKWPERKMVIPHIRTTFPASAMFQVDEGDVDELALLFTEDLNVNAITTEGDSAAFPIHADQHEEIDLEDFLDEENLKGYRIEEETLDEDTWEDDDLPDLLPHLMVPHGLETLEFEIFCEHGDPESHLRKYREKMALHTNNEFLMISTFHESLPECAVTWFYQLKNITCWRDLARAFLDRYQCNRKAATPPAKDPDSITITKEGEEPLKIPPSDIITTTSAEEEYAGPMVEGLSIHTIAGEEDSTTTPPTRHCQQGEEAKTWTCVPLLQRVSSSNEITRKTSNDPHVSEIDNKTNCSLDNIDNSDEEIELPNDILEALARQDEGSKPNIEELETVNLADEGEEPREVKIGTRCATEKKEALIALLREFHEIFAWSYQDMPGLDTDIVVHKIPLKPECKPVKQALRRMKPEVILKIKEEVEKQLKAGFLSTVTYSDWVANIVPVPKKDGKVRMCVDYRDLNRASPKDNFPLPHIDTLVDNTATNAVFSFMDGFSGYNQIKMAEEDKSKTAFVTHWGTFVYDVMPFGLKNAGATYQRAMVTLFHDMIHHEIEVYVDDMIAKSRTAQDHLTDLRKLFQRLKKYQLRLNPNKCAFGVTSGKLLGFIVSGRGIEIDPAKLASLHSLLRPASPLFKLLRKDVKIKWTEDCQRAFDKIKEYLLNPPILVPPTPGRPLILYLTVQEASMGCMLGQQDETGKKEQAIYYLSKKFTEPETRYLLVEKTCCALAWASKKLRQYMLYYTTWLVSRMDPIKYIFEKPALTGKIARWQVLLSEFDILFVARKAIKGQAIADYLADYPSEQLELMDSEFPDEDVMTVDEDNHGRWKLYFDGAANAVGSGIGAVLVSPKGQQTPIATNGEWQARDPKLIPYQRYISRLVPKFKYITFTYTPRAHNHFADALATLASLIKLVEGDDVRPLRNRDSRHPSILCVHAEEANRLIQEMHAGLMGAHANGPFLARKIMRAGYYWLTMERDCIRHVQTCHKCQMYQNSKNAPPQYLHTMASPWPFSAWGMDVIGAITPKASNGHEFILVAIDYFTKWVEACSFKNVTQVAVTRFVKNNIHLPLRNARNAHHRQCFQPEQPHDGSAMPAVQDPASQLCAIPSEDERSRHPLEPLPTLWYMGWKQYCQVEVEIPSLRILSQTQLEEAEWAQARYEQLNFIDEKRLAALCHGQLYQRRIERAYNKKARPRTFQPGDLVLKKRNMALSDPRGKFAPSYEGPYVVKKAFSGRSNHSG
uniref:RNA-directed DNA polymerase n=1 Tax=Fagus sylvatica TaxID=28930 RepID=A0A2N9GU32_FAGSY